MRLLVSKGNIEKYLKISFHRKVEDIERFVREVQLFDLKPLMCERFFLDLTNPKNEEKYTELLNGGSYEYKGVEYPFEGLKAVISYFFYARYIFKSHQTDTPFGIVQKKYQDSEPLSPTERRDMNKMYKQQANDLWEDIVRYMNRNAAKYPIWNDCYGCDDKPERKSGIRVSVF